MMAFVVDTNVPVVANGSRSPQADLKCVQACIGALESIHRDGLIVLDDSMLILDEYRRHLSPSGQPGVGDFFMKWVFSIQADKSRCEQVTITPHDSDPMDFHEFPRDPGLQSFDRSDRKFVAVALASNKSPTVLNAVDSDWVTHGQALSSKDVRITNLCPQCISREQ